MGRSETEGFSRMTFVVEGTDKEVDQVIKQLDKLIDVIRVSDISKEDVVSRELALIKIHTSNSTRPEVLQLAETFRSHVVDVSTDSVIIEVTGDGQKITSLIRILEPYGISEVMRTGQIGLIRGISEFPRP